MDWKKEVAQLELFPKPRKSSSKASPSLYLGIKKGKRVTLILQYLPKNSKTSCHYHKHLQEKHHLLAGTCYIWKHTKLRRLKDGETTRPNEPHRLETKKEGCLLLLEVMHGNFKNWEKDKVVV